MLEKAASDLGVDGYPSLLFIGPNGRIANSSKIRHGPSLRNFELEIICTLMLTNAERLPLHLFAVRD